MKRLLWVVLFLSVVAFLGSFGVVSSYASRAKLMQRAQVDDAAASLFGDSTPTKIGSPQLMIVDDPKAILPGKGDRGAELLNESYLKSSGKYPLQLKTVEFVASLSRIGAAVVALLSLAGIGFLSKRKAR